MMETTGKTTSDNRLYRTLSFAFFMGVFGYWLSTVYTRLYYPYDLEWMEGGMLIHAWRLQQGLGLYVEPSSDFIPYIYPPLYPTLLNWMTIFGPLDYWMGRSISIAGSLMATTALMVGLRREGISKSMVWLSGALWISTYDDSGTFLDLTRADGLMMGLLAWSMVLVRWNKLVWAGLLCWLAFLAKHNAAIVGIPIALWLWQTKGWQQALRFGLSSAGPALGSIALLQYQSDGRFLQYLLDVPAHHPIVGQRLFWLSVVELFTPVLWLFGLLAILAGFQQWSSSRWRSGIWLLTCIGFFAMLNLPQTVYPTWWGSPKHGMIPFAIALWVGTFLSWFPLTRCIRHLRLGLRAWMSPAETEESAWNYWMSIGITVFLFSTLMRGHHGGYTNVLMPGLWGIAFLTPLFIQKMKGPSWLWHGIFMIQIGLGLWSNEQYIPTEADKSAGDRIVTELRTRQGPIFAPHAPWLPVQAGFEPTTHLIALWDIDHEGGPFAASVSKIKKDIQQQRWGTIVTADRKLGFGLNDTYQYSETIRPTGSDFLPKVGWKVRPSYLYVPK